MADAWADSIRARLLPLCHPKQRQFVEDPGRRVAARVGRGGGKTTAWVVRAVIKATRIKRARLIFIATTRVAAEELIWEKLKTLLGELDVASDFNETKLRCRIKRTSSVIRLVGADDKREIEKLRGQSFHEVGIDEMASHPPELLEQLIDRVIGPRLGDVDGVICMFGTPGHILRGPAYDATRPGSPRHRPYDRRDDAEFAGWLGWSSHSWTLRDAADAGIVAQRKLWAEALREKQEKGWSDDNPVWLREYLGEWAADNTDTIFKFRAYAEDGSTMWNLWDPERSGPMSLAKLPDIPGAEWLVVYGADMGHSDPFALTAWAYSPQDRTRTVYQIFEFERTKMYAQTIAKVLLGEADNVLGVCDASSPSGLIGETGWPTALVADVTHLGQSILDELANVYGVRFAPALQKEKFAGIEQVNGWLIPGRVKVLKGSLLAQQIATLQWQVNEFGEMKENKAQANHLTDSMLYALRKIANAWEGEYQEAKEARDAYTETRRPQRRPQPDDDPVAEPDPWGAFGQDLLAPGEFVEGDM